MKIVFVGGFFDKKSGKESGLINKISNYIKSNFENYSNMEILNGGNINDLNKILNNVKKINILFWFPEIDNKESKIVQKLKEINPKLYLIQSKVNNDRYTILDISAIGLRNKTNLMVEINKIKENKRNIFKLSIHDPLGNMFYDGTNYKEFSKILIERTNFLIKMTRKKTTKIGEIDENLIPNEIEFFNIVENYGKEFHKLTHAINPDRYLGNCSFRTFDFRCTFGFPSFKNKDGVIYVSKRNVDKREINKSSFVPVINSIGSIHYLGDKKPSVDTPIQVKLYYYFKNINYMIHSHVYIKDAPFTKEIIPCGSLEEINEINEMFENKNKDFYVINLKGHGSIIMSNDLEKLKNIEYISRKFPEKQF